MLLKRREKVDPGPDGETVSSLVMGAAVTISVALVGQPDLLETDTI